METKVEAENEEKAIQRLPHLEIYWIYSHQILTVFWMPRSACWKELDTAISWKAMSESDIERQMRTANHWTEHSIPVEEVEKLLKELKGFEIA